MGKHRVQAVADGSRTVRSKRQAEVEVKVEQRPDFPHLSLSLNLLLTLADFFNSLLSWLFDLWQGQESGLCDMVGVAG